MHRYVGDRIAFYGHKVGIETDFVVMGMGYMVVMWGWGLSVRECGDGYKVSKCTFL